MNFKNIINELTKKNKTIATMESCTGGGVVNAITNIEGASEVLKFSAVTYSNEYKIKMGVKKDIIDKYSVYSQKTADEMALNISKFTNSDYGIGITGKLNRCDRFNPFSADNVVYISIYDKEKNEFKQSSLEVKKENRSLNKDLVITKIIQMLEDILK